MKILLHLILVLLSSVAPLLVTAARILSSVQLLSAEELTQGFDFVIVGGGLAGKYHVCIMNKTSC